ncbi:hypothetical protein N7448_004287 [Penicillium atrosanguineum]|uniref:uncharacterized protein n=1 Tax=Penicillium atrosanguineum TaxID=1132637 RepID=UPI00239EFDCE|nr:uncharacterized protein N7443_003252 [Penicillium atrosanguineum]KAJ5118066.1 hypothetical protein N7526_011089 [Penicillium atrosanguineum]KAJ5140879.1 hypothetical protein N7448_004287 [Penicillium atrosanguineum]KAJ5310791.1 hypothetical protein N7443_003252 [Penicillium atrosanguineum]
MQNPACLLYGPGDARFEDRPLPLIEDPYDVIIRIAYVGVCGSDVHFWTHGGVKRFVSPSNPLVMGHEASGIVHSVGPAVSTLQPGDQVAIEPGRACRLCSRCKLGKYNLCPQMEFAASPPNHGALCKYFKMPADCCYKIPTSVGRSFGLDEAVLVEPLSVAVHSVRQVGVQPGDKVVVFGAGTVGLLCAAVAREFGASVITSVDISRDKLDFAHSFIPNGRLSFSTAIPTHSLSPEENAQCLRGMHRNAHITETDVSGFDVAIEATGAESCIQMAIHALRVGGSFVQTGLGQRNVSFPISTVSENEINVKGCFRYGPGDYKMALELAFTRKIELKSLITKVFPFEKTVEAWEKTKRGEGIKTLIRGVGYMVEDDEENEREVKGYRPEYM